MGSCFWIGLFVEMLLLFRAKACWVKPLCSFDPAAVRDLHSLSTGAPCSHALRRQRQRSVQETQSYVVDVPQK